MVFALSFVGLNYEQLAHSAGALALWREKSCKSVAFLGHWGPAEF